VGESFLCDSVFPMDWLSVHHKVGTFPFSVCELEHSYLNIALKGFFVLKE